MDETPLLKRPVTRRNFLAWWLTGLLTAFAVAIVAPILVFIYPPASSTQKQKKTITLTQSLDTLQEGQGVTFAAPSEFGFVMIDGGGDNYPGKISFNGFVNKIQGKLILVSATCSHLGCTITANYPAARFQCPCHGSQFSLVGEVIHGPAVANLSHFNWQQTSTPTQIIVEGVALPGVG